MTRTWCNESTTFYEFFFLGHESIAGSIVVSTNRTEQTRLQVKVTVDVEGRINYAETTELSEHSRTGLYGVTSRTTEGPLTPATLKTLTPAHAEIFEYAPESALSTMCGAWLSDLLEWVFQTAMREDRLAVPIDLSMSPEPMRAEPVAPPTPPRNEVPRVPPPPPPPRPSVSPEPPPVPMPSPEPPVGVARRAAPDLLVATTNSGDRWEVEGPETYMGRSKQCSIVLKSQRVSRKHASITREDDGFYINDLGAANGIWAGTDKVDREKIEDGSEYIIGDVLVSFAYA